jgi:hypothetical protein
MSFELMNMRQLNDFHGFFLIAGQEEDISRRASHELFRVVRDEEEKASTWLADLLPEKSPGNLG